MNENIEFLQAFLKNPGKVGSIKPSSPDLARRMVEGFTPTSTDIVMELGVGTGAITKFIQEAIPDGRSYLGIERDGALVRHLKKKYPDVRIVRGDARDAIAIHSRSGFGKVGYIVCCLPFVSLPKEISNAIFHEIDKFMQQGCTFRTFQYAHGYYLRPAIKFREFMRNRYGRSKRSPMVVKNVPPAYTLTWCTRQQPAD